MRKVGGIYLTCGQSPWGRPLEEFVLCPPIPVDLKSWGVADIGTTLIEKEIACPRCRLNGVLTNGCGKCGGTGRYRACHVVDVVGRKFYNHVADFLEEARRQGVSRRSSIGSAADYGRLNEDSRMLLVHSRAYISNYPAFTAAGRMTQAEEMATQCPHNRKGHDLFHERREGERLIVGPEEMCGQLWYHDLTGDLGGVSFGEDEELLAGFRRMHPKWTDDDFEANLPRLGRRKVHDGLSYLGFSRPEKVRPQYEYAIFGSFPITQIELVDPDRQYRDREKKARASRIPVSVVAE